MSKNIIRTNGGFMIFNGGNGLKDCPKTFEEAHKWSEEVNIENNMDFWESPQWSFDCGFKLDYDGPILHISSRFYPPKTYYGGKWDGTVTIYIFNKKIHEEEFDCKTLKELRQKVEFFIFGLKDKIKIEF